MNLRSPFWGFKVDKVGDAFAAEKISNFGPRKVGLKIICQILHVTIKPLYKPVRAHQQGREPKRNEGENDVFVID